MSDTANNPAPIGFLAHQIRRGFTMSVKYNVIERGHPSDQTAPKKYYPSAVASGLDAVMHVV